MRNEHVLHSLCETPIPLQYLFDTHVHQTLKCKSLAYRAATVGKLQQFAWQAHPHYAERSGKLCNKHKDEEFANCGNIYRLIVFSSFNTLEAISTQVVAKSSSTQMKRYCRICALQNAATFVEAQLSAYGIIHPQRHFALQMQYFWDLNNIDSSKLYDNNESLAETILQSFKKLPNHTIPKVNMEQIYNRIQEPFENEDRHMKLPLCYQSLKPFFASLNTQRIDNTISKKGQYLNKIVPTPWTDFLCPGICCFPYVDIFSIAHHLYAYIMDVIHKSYIPDSQINYRAIQLLMHTFSDNVLRTPILYTAFLHLTWLYIGTLYPRHWFANIWSQIFKNSVISQRYDHRFFLNCITTHMIIVQNRIKEDIYMIYNLMHMPSSENTSCVKQSYQEASALKSFEVSQIFSCICSGEDSTYKQCDGKHQCAPCKLSKKAFFRPIDDSTDVSDYDICAWPSIYENIVEPGAGISPKIKKYAFLDHLRGKSNPERRHMRKKRRIIESIMERPIQFAIDIWADNLFEVAKDIQYSDSEFSTTGSSCSPKVENVSSPKQCIANHCVNAFQSPMPSKGDLSTLDTVQTPIHQNYPNKEKFSKRKKMIPIDTSSSNNYKAESISKPNEVSDKTSGVSPAITNLGSSDQNGESMSHKEPEINTESTQDSIPPQEAAPQSSNGQAIEGSCTNNALTFANPVYAQDTYSKSTSYIGNAMNNNPPKNESMPINTYEKDIKCVTSPDGSSTVYQKPTTEYCMTYSNNINSTVYNAPNAANGIYTGKNPYESSGTVQEVNHTIFGTNNAIYNPNTNNNNYAGNNINTSINSDGNTTTNNSSINTSNHHIDNNEKNNSDHLSNNNNHTNNSISTNYDSNGRLPGYESVNKTYEANNIYVDRSSNEQGNLESKAESVGINHVYNSNRNIIETVGYKTNLQTLYESKINNQIYNNNNNTNVKPYGNTTQLYNPIVNNDIVKAMNPSIQAADPNAYIQDPNKYLLDTRNQTFEKESQDDHNVYINMNDTSSNGCYSTQIECSNEQVPKSNILPHRSPQIPAPDSNDDMDYSKPKIPGVRYDPTGHRWVASWSHNCRQIARYFPVNKYGNRLARELAIQTRLEATSQSGIATRDSRRKSSHSKFQRYNNNFEASQNDAFDSFMHVDAHTEKIIPTAPMYHRPMEPQNMDQASCNIPTRMYDMPNILNSTNTTNSTTMPSQNPMYINYMPNNMNNTDKVPEQMHILTNSNNNMKSYETNNQAESEHNIENFNNGAPQLGTGCKMIKPSTLYNQDKYVLLENGHLQYNSYAPNI